MVFHDIESLTDVLSGHRIIVYYIEGDTTNKVNLCNSVESVMEMLQKKNDDMIIFKIYQNTPLFSQFKELYKPHIDGLIALFIINNEGIPLICEHVNEEHDIPQIVESICTCCKLSAVSRNEINKLISSESRKTPTKQTESIMDELQDCNNELPNTSLVKNNMPTCFGVDNKKMMQPIQSISAELQIRLPDGSKDNQKFDKEALLQEVNDFIHTKYGIRDFYMKTYTRNFFNESDYESTLEDLDLTPNGVIIVVYKNVDSIRNGGTLSSLMRFAFWNIFAKTSSVLLYFRGLLFAFWNSFFSSSSTSTKGIQNKSGGSSSAGQPRSSNGLNRSGSRRFGNIHTLQRNDDSDDENNRYNGNSTQQK